LSSLDGRNGFTVYGSRQYLYAGLSVASGDVNGDAISDLIIGAPSVFFRSTSVGEVHVVFGKSTSWEPSMQVWDCRDP